MTKYENNRINSRCSMNEPAKGSTVLFVTNTDWYFVSHRLKLAERLSALGYDVHVAAAPSGAHERIIRSGLTFHGLNVPRGVASLRREVQAIADLRRLMKQLQPEIIHLVAVRAIIHGFIARTLLRVRLTIFAPAGLGYGYRDGSWQRRALLIVLRTIFSSARSVTIFQTIDDQVEASPYRRGAKSVVILGAGVDCDHYKPSPTPPVPVALFAARLIAEKGVIDFVDALRELRRRGRPIVGMIVGRPEPDLPSSISSSMLRDWEQEGVIKFLGFEDDMRRAFGRATVFVFPSYHREGLPKVILEAAASGVPIVASDIAGCRAFVENRRNGLLVPTHSPLALADGIEQAMSTQLASRLSEAARNDVVEGFSEKLVISQTLALYTD